MKRAKRSTKAWITFIVVALACLTLGAFVGSVYNNFVRSVNKDNLWQDATFAGGVNGGDDTICDGADGIIVKVTKYNEIVVKGCAEKDMKLLIASVPLKSETRYVFDSSLNDGSNGTVYMVMEDSTNSVTEYKSYTGPVVIEEDSWSDSPHMFDVYLVIKKDTEINKTLRPVICEGDHINDLVSFFE